MKKGVYERVFHLIWSKSEFMSSQNNISLNLPNTILFENGQPLYWYFSNNSGNILKKKRDSVTVNNIKTFFENKKNESGIIAYFISTIPSFLLNRNIIIIIL